MLTDLTLLEARCDWLTVSAKPGPNLESMAGIAALGLLEEQKHGERLRTWRSIGYDVAKAGSWLYAQGPVGGYVSVGGEDAERWLRALLVLADHCSRIDYAATIQYPTALDNPVPIVLNDLRTRYANDRFSESIQHYRGLKRDRGVTVGQRSAPYYGRLYDKTMESRGRYPRGSWRFEIELKRHASEFEHAQFRANPSRVDFAGRIVREHFARWSIEVPAVQGPTVRMAKQIRPPSDAERALRWLERQVRPTIEWLFEIGRGEDVKRVLFSDLGISQEVA